MTSLPSQPKDLVAVNVMVSPAECSPEAIKTALSAPGVVEVEQTFPGERDEELSRLYVIKVRRDDVEDVVERLRRSAAVEYAEPVPLRRLIR